MTMISVELETGVMSDNTKRYKWTVLSAFLTLYKVKIRSGFFWQNLRRGLTNEKSEFENVSKPFFFFFPPHSFAPRGDLFDLHGGSQGWQRFVTTMELCEAYEGSHVFRTEDFLEHSGFSVKSGVFFVFLRKDSMGEGQKRRCWWGNDCFRLVLTAFRNIKCWLETIYTSNTSFVSELNHSGTEYDKRTPLCAVLRKESMSGHHSTFFFLQLFTMSGVIPVFVCFLYNFLIK